MASINQSFRQLFWSSINVMKCNEVSWFARYLIFWTQNIPVCVFNSKTVSQLILQKIDYMIIAVQIPFHLLLMYWWAQRQLDLLGFTCDCSSPSSCSVQKFSGNHNDSVPEWNMEGDSLRGCRSNTADSCQAWLRYLTVVEVIIDEDFVSQYLSCLFCVCTCDVDSMKSLLFGEKSARFLWWKPAFSVSGICMMFLESFTLTFCTLNSSDPAATEKSKCY